MSENSSRAPGVAEAIEIAAAAHRGQTDKAGAPYILHPLRLMMKMESETAMIVAVLHDVVEDSPDWTFERLRERGFSDEVVAALDSVTRRETESYEEFCMRAGENPVGRQVKIADLEDNMNVLRIASLTDKDHARITRYHAAWSKLKQLA